MNKFLLLTFFLISFSLLAQDHTIEIVGYIYTYDDKTISNLSVKCFSKKSKDLLFVDETTSNGYFNGKVILNKRNLTTIRIEVWIEHKEKLTERFFEIEKDEVKNHLKLIKLQLGNNEKTYNEILKEMGGRPVNTQNNRKLSKKKTPQKKYSFPPKPSLPNKSKKQNPVVLQKFYEKEKEKNRKLQNENTNLQKKNDSLKHAILLEKQKHYTTTSERDIFKTQYNQLYPQYEKQKRELNILLKNREIEISLLWMIPTDNQKSTNKHYLKKKSKKEEILSIHFKDFGKVILGGNYHFIGEAKMAQLSFRVEINNIYSLKGFQIDESAQRRVSASLSGTFSAELDLGDEDKEEIYKLLTKSYTNKILGRVFLYYGIGNGLYYVKTCQFWIHK